MPKRRSTAVRLPLTLKNWMDEGTLVLNPKYQRNAVWKRPQKQLLIDSLLINMDIPKIYLHERIDGGVVRFDVVDGQQRLRTIFEFFENEFPLAEDQDPFGDDVIAGKRWRDLPPRVQAALTEYNLDVCTLSTDFSEDDVEDFFVRLQEGVPLNAAEKRRALPGTMREVVRHLAEHDVFRLVNFKNRRYEHEDAVAKVLHMRLAGEIVQIRPDAIRQTYKRFAKIDADHPRVKELKRALDFLAGAFEGKANPSLRKYAILTLSYLTCELLPTYDMKNHGAEFADAYLDFEEARIANEALPEEQQDPSLAAFTDAARADSVPDMTYRHEYLREQLLERMPFLVQRDPEREFTAEQRRAIYRRGGGICVKCRALGDAEPVPWEEFEADHVVPHSKGGPTSVENGQVLCRTHNREKGAG